MSKYINAKEIERVIRNDVPLKLLMTNSLDCAIRNGIEIAKIISEKAKPADVAEVIRCKDCVYSREMSKYEKEIHLENCIGCTMHSKSYHDQIMKDDDFCSYGERKEGNDR